MALPRRGAPAAAVPVHPHERREDYAVDTRSCCTDTAAMDGRGSAQGRERAGDAEPRIESVHAGGAGTEDGEEVYCDWRGECFCFMSMSMFAVCACLTLVRGGV